MGHLAVSVFIKSMDVYGTPLSNLTKISTKNPFSARYKTEVTLCFSDETILGKILVGMNGD
jgi:hypothetical protein